MVTNRELKAIEEYKDWVISTLITEFNIESNNVGKVPSRSIKCQYIAAQMEALLNNRMK